MWGSLRPQGRSFKTEWFGKREQQVDQAVPPLFSEIAAVSQSVRDAAGLRIRRPCVARWSAAARAPCRTYRRASCVHRRRLHDDAGRRRLSAVVLSLDADYGRPAGAGDAAQHSLPVAVTVLFPGLPVLAQRASTASSCPVAASLSPASCSCGSSAGSAFANPLSSWARGSAARACTSCPKMRRPAFVVRHLSLGKGDRYPAGYAASFRNPETFRFLLR